MPIPVPRQDETPDEFISRCMSDETMREDFPDTDQRFAVCQAQTESSAHYGIPDTPRCFQSHMGVWAIHTPWLQQALAAVLAGEMLAGQMQAAVLDANGQQGPFVQNNLLVVPIHDQITKAGGKFGGTSTIRTRRALRQALNDKSVNGAILHIDSPGGHVDGVHELSEEVRIFAQSKPIHGFIEDLGASAALWVAAHVERLSMNAPGEVGSIGAFALLHDFSEAMEREGIRVIPVSSGPLKGAGAPGTPITDEVVAEVQQSVNRIHGFFVRALARGRRMRIDEVEELADGRLLSSRQALKANLVDAVETFDEAVNALQRRAATRARKRALLTSMED